MAQTIRIANPLPGGNSYTSVKNAENLVSRGKGEIRNGAFHFDETLHLLCSNSEINRQMAEERTFSQRGVIFWNGSRNPKDVYPPFCNVQFDRPDAAFA